MSNLKNKDRFEHEIVLKILTKSEPRCFYKIVLIKKKECTTRGKLVHNPPIAVTLSPTNPMNRTH